MLVFYDSALIANSGCPLEPLLLRVLEKELVDLDYALLLPRRAWTHGLPALRGSVSIAVRPSFQRECI